MLYIKSSRSDHASAALEEKILLNKLAKGDRDAFWPLWELHRDYLTHRCRVWMGGNQDDANEAMSLASLKVWHKLPDYAPKITNLKGWLNRLIHNLCVDIHRQRKQDAIITDNIDNKKIDIQSIENSSFNHPEATLLQQELKIYLRYGIDDLPPRLRHPLILHYYREMSYADIGKELSISQDNVSKRLQQAKQILKKQLCQYFSGLNTTVIDEAKSQELEQKDFQVSINIDPPIEEINYRITVSCLENLTPVWCNSLHALGWI